jgi:hypothetical protein
VAALLETGIIPRGSGHLDRVMIDVFTDIIDALPRGRCIIADQGAELE